MTIQQLKKSLIFNVSLSSKELFHSNLWAWLLEQDKNLANILFGFNLLDINNAIIKREVGSKNDKMDILIEDIEHRFIIENKIKSVPKFEQLIRYTNLVNLNGIFVEGVLTGIKEPDFELPNNWRFVRYSVLAENLSRYIQQIDIFSNLINYVSLLNEYVEVLISIDQHVNDRLEATEFQLDYNADSLVEIKFDDVYKKFKASEFLKYIKQSQNLANLEIPNGLNFYTKLDFNHKNATITFEISNNNLDISIGIQIEGNQYRYFIRTDYDRDVNDTFEEYATLDWFDDGFNRQLNRIVHGYQTSMKGRINNQFNTYEGFRENYQFIYQYNIIQNNYFDVLENRITNDLTRAVNILNRHEDNNE